MKILKEEEGKITLGGVTVSNLDTSKIKEISSMTEENIETTCDRINAILQILSNAWNDLKSLAKRLLETLAVKKEDICESCTGRRTRHGSRAERPEEAKADIKWHEKYRPP